MPALLERFNRPLVAILAVAVIAGPVRFLHLGSPATRIFDEFYYSKAACILLGDSNKVCDVQSSDEKYWRRNKWDVGSWVHPPLGKWMIAVGEKLFGADNPFGWRFSAAVAGTLLCLMVACIAQLLWGRPVWTFVAGLLASVESLDFMLSRLALLDIFVAFWAVLGFLCLLLDRRWVDRRTPADDAEPLAELEAGDPQTPELLAAQPEGADPNGADGEATNQTSGAPRPRRVPSPILRPWRFAAGAAFGAAFSTKWAGAYAFLGAVVLTYAWETTRRMRAGVHRRSAFLRAFTWETFGMLLAFIVVPIAVYMAVWIPWFHHFGWSIRDWWANQVATADYHIHLTWTSLDPKTHEYTPNHPYFSHAYTWLAMTRPVSMFVRQVDDMKRQILAVGNPAIFWVSGWTLPYLAWRWWVRGHDWRAGFILAAALSQYLPWFIVSRPQFFYYMSPVSPFLALAAAYTAKDLWETHLVVQGDDGEVIRSARHPYRPFVWIYLATAVGLFVWFYPVLTGRPVSLEHYRWVVWFRSWL